jgi:prevent-host-death family protein
MPTVNMHQAKTNLSRYVDAIESGTESEVIIARNGKPAARLVPVPEKQVIRFGLAKGKFALPDGFDADDVLIEKMFDGQRAG